MIQILIPITIHNEFPNFFVKCYFSFLQIKLQYLPVSEKFVKSKSSILPHNMVIFRETKLQYLISQKCLHNFVGKIHNFCVSSKLSRKFMKSSFTSIFFYMFSSFYLIAKKLVKSNLVMVLT